MTPPKGEPAIAKLQRWHVSCGSRSWAIDNIELAMYGAWGANWNSYRRHCWREYQRRSNAGADRFTEYKLIVFGGQARHHKAKNMHESPNRHGKVRSILVEWSAC
jgi:hypothetical protein